MITGVHAMLYAQDADRARAFFRDVIGWRWIDSGGGWLIFDLPPGELGVHPGNETGHLVSFICDDIEATVSDLSARGVEFTQPITEREYGRVTAFAVPGAGEVELYQASYARPSG